MINIKIVILSLGYVDYNVYNIFEPQNYILLILLYNDDIRHYDYLGINKQSFIDENIFPDLYNKIRYNIERQVVINKKFIKKFKNITRYL